MAFHHRQNDTSPTAGLIALAVAVLLGASAGIGAFTFVYADGLAYLDDDPATCANCHVMRGHYASWLQSSHEHVATCNSCHLGQGFFGKWIVKADNGFFHALAFTTDSFHRPIQIKARNRKITQDACLACHRDVVDATLPVHADEASRYCADCHSDVGHAGRRTGYANRQ
jgi:cytochrome c nitrite reductase small subunit